METPIGIIISISSLSLNQIGENYINKQKGLSYKDSKNIKRKEL